MAIDTTPSLSILAEVTLTLGNPVDVIPGLAQILISARNLGFVPVCNMATGQVSLSRTTIPLVPTKGCDFAVRPSPIRTDASKI